MKSKKLVVKDTYIKPKHFNPRKFVYLFLLAVLVSGILYQRISIYLNANRYARVGELIDVGTSTMHVYTGGQGDITFVLSANIGAISPYASLSPLHQELSKMGKVVVYDKPGYGWSDFTKAPRDLDTLTAEIHTALTQSQQTTPYILVAHSLGSLEALRYAQRYPEEVAGILLIDGASPSFCKTYNNIMIAESFLLNLSRQLGLLRLGNKWGYFDYALLPNPELDEEALSLSKGLGLEKIWNRNILEEQLHVKSNAKLILEAGDLGALPIYFLTSTSNIYGNWNQTQQEFFSLSSQAKQFPMKGSSEQIEKKDLPDILNACNELLTYLQPDEE